MRGARPWSPGCPGGQLLVLPPVEPRHAGGVTPAEAVAHAHDWFESNSGWAPPDPDTLAEWSVDGMGRAPDDCLVAPEGWCAHGLASWQLILDALDD